MAYPNPPSVAIEPNGAAAAGCTAVATIHDQWTDGTNWIQGYTLTATPAAGWAFDKFTWNLEEKDQTGTVVWSESETATDNPYDNPVSDLLADFYTVIDTDPLETLQRFVLNVVAHFKPTTATDLLVNSYSRSAPTQLVYDDRPGGTGLLIADY